MRQVCRQCNDICNPNTDVPFITLNPEKKEDSPLPAYTQKVEQILFCSTACLLTFISEKENYPQIAFLEPDKMTTTVIDPLKYSVRTFLEYRHGRIGCFHCSFRCDEDNWVSMKDHGPFCFVAGFPFGDTPVPFCSGITCLQEYCATHTFSAKNYLITHPKPQCTHCKSVFSPNPKQVITGMIVLNENEYHDGFRMLLLKGHAPNNAKIIFCSAGCIAAHLGDPANHKKVYRIKKTIYQPITRERCTCCKEDFPHGAIAVSAPYGSIWDSIWGVNYFCSPECIVQAFFIDAEEMKTYGIGPWYTITHE